MLIGRTASVTFLCLNVLGRARHALVRPCFGCLEWQFRWGMLAGPVSQESRVVGCRVKDGTRGRNSEGLERVLGNQPVAQKRQ